MDNASTQTNKDNLDSPKQKDYKKWLLAILVIVILILLVPVGLAIHSWLAIRSSVEKNVKTESTSYLTSDRNVICAVNERPTLQCENVQTGEVKKFVIPKQYQKAASIRQSPDGMKLLVETNEGNFVTDLNFKNEKKLEDLYKFADTKSLRQIMWADDSKYLLIGEIKREQNDADFLPEPLVVSMLDLDTSESKRVYKTGERDDVDSINVLGSNTEYLFISIPATKNWVAQETNPPPAILNAIRLSDGFVNQVNSYQLNQIGNDFNRYYGNGLFLFEFQGENAANSLAGAQMEQNDFGLVLSRVVDKLSISGSVIPIFASKGILVSNYNDEAQSYNYYVMSDNGTKNDLKLVTKDPHTPFFNISQMPNLLPAE